MSKYTDLITNYHAGKPKFFDHVDLSTRPLIDVSAATAGLITALTLIPPSATSWISSESGSAYPAR
jgi:hypothetical protein